MLNNFLICNHSLSLSCSVSGGDAKALPHPDEDWAAFFSIVKAHSQAEGLIWDPITKTMREWVDLKKLQSMYGATTSGSSSCTIS